MWQVLISREDSKSIWVYVLSFTVTARMRLDIINILLLIESTVSLTSAQFTSVQFCINEWIIIQL